MVVIAIEYVIISLDEIGVAAVVALILRTYVVKLDGFDEGGLVFDYHLVWVQAVGQVPRAICCVKGKFNHSKTSFPPHLLDNTLSHLQEIFPSSDGITVNGAKPFIIRFARPYFNSTGAAVCR